jgi:hypothetical protein
VAILDPARLVCGRGFAADPFAEVDVRDAVVWKVAGRFHGVGVDEFPRLDFDSGLLPDLPLGGLGRRLAQVEFPPRRTPPQTVGPFDDEEPTLVVEDERDGGYLRGDLAEIGRESLPDLRGGIANVSP